MTQYEVVATITACVAILASIASIAVSVDANRRSHATQRRLVEVEEARERDRVSDRESAAIRAGFVVGTNGQRYLRFANVGNGTARDIAITLDGTPMAADGTVEGDNRIRIVGGMFATLGPGAHVDALATSMLGVKPSYLLRVTWTDDSGEPGSWQSDVR